MTSTPQPSVDPKRYARWQDRRKILREWAARAGRVGVAAEDRRRFDALPQQWSSSVVSDRRELYSDMRRLEAHLKVCRGNGRGCACRLLNLGLSAFSSDGIHHRRAHAAMLSAALLGSLIAVLYWQLFTSFANEAVLFARLGTRNGELQAALLLGISGGFAVAVCQAIYASLIECSKYIGQRMVAIGRHPDGPYLLLPRLIPSKARALRIRRICRELEALSDSLKPPPDASSAPPLPAPAQQVHQVRQGAPAALAAGIAMGGLVLSYVLRRYIAANSRTKVPDPPH